MKERLFDLFIGGLAGFVLAAGLSLTCYDQRMRELQDVNHQVKVTAMRIVAHSDSLQARQQHRADSLQRARQPIILRAVLDTTAANDAHAAADRARAIGDLRAENVALRVENIALRRAVVNLWTAMQTADTIIALERARGDSLNKALGDVHLQLQTLASKVESLKPPPKLLRIAWHVVEDAGFAWAGYQWGKHQRCQDASCQPVRVQLLR